MLSANINKKVIQPPFKETHRLKGIIFNLVETIIRNEYGEDTWDDLLDAAELDGAYSSLGSYDDQDLYKIVGAASKKLDVPPAEVVRWVGYKALPLMAASFPGFFEGHSETRTFVLSLNDIIHPEVRKLYPGADVPVFDFDTSDANVLVVGYHSHRKMCTFAIGLIQGAAEHYKQVAKIDEPLCMHRGDARCEFRIEFTSVEG